MFPLFLSVMLSGHVDSFQMPGLQPRRWDPCHLFSDSHADTDAVPTKSLVSRRQILQSLVVMVGTAALPAVAEEETDPAVVQAAFDAVRQQVFSDTGGVAQMQRYIDQRDFGALMEFTKTYDQVLRKGAMGKAKKLLADKQIKEQATLYSNGVTFDLIGINRSSRPGQENAEQANKYLQELREDVQKFMDLQPKS